MITYGILFCTASGKESCGYYTDRPRENQSFVLHQGGDGGVVVLPRIFQIVRIPQTILEVAPQGMIPQGADTLPGDWVFYTPFSRYVLREYHPPVLPGA